MRGLIFVAAFLVAACSGPTPSSASPSGTASPSLGSKAPCLDRADLADQADPAVNAMAALIADLKVPDVTRATADARTAADAMRKVAAFVAPVEAAAAQDLITAAAELDSAVPMFPAGAASVGKAQTDMQSALTLARTAACPS